MFSRSTAMAVCLLAILAACTATAPPTPTSLPTPTLQPPFTPAPASPTATAQPATPTAEPATPAPSPTAPVTVPPTTSPEPSVGTIGYVEIFNDDFSDPTSGWGTGQTAGGTASYLDGTLDLTPSQAPAYIWSRRQVDGTWAAMRVSGTLLPAPESEGYLGLLCGGENDHLIGAVVSTQGAWVLARIRDGDVEVLEQDQQAGLDVGMAEPILMTLDCVVQDDGALGLALNVNGQEVIATGVPDAPAALDRVATYAEATEGSFVARFDDVSVIGSDSPDGLPPLISAEANELLQHVPEAYRPGCFETPVPSAEPGAIVAVACALPDGSNVELAEYVQFESAGAMTTAYQQRVATYGEGEDQSCQEGPAEGPYTIGGDDAGRLLCADQTDGARYDWTDTRLNILSNLTDFDGDYAALYDEWLEAGPNP